MSDIQWPAGFVPGFTDNFCSNEVIVTGISVDAAWHLLATPTLQAGAYFYGYSRLLELRAETELALGDRFDRLAFNNFVIDQGMLPPDLLATQPARLAWHGWAGNDETDRLDVHHAWLIEALSENRVRILTQETQVGAPAKQLASDPSHPMIHGHQQWLDGIVRAARQQLRTEA